MLSDTGSQLSVTKSELKSLVHLSSTTAIKELTEPSSKTTCSGMHRFSVLPTPLLTNVFQKFNQVLIYLVTFLVTDTNITFLIFAPDFQRPYENLQTPLSAFSFAPWTYISATISQQNKVYPID